jgi:hypothetical protein
MAMTPKPPADDKDKKLDRDTPTPEKPGKFTVEGLRARGFKVPEPRGEGFIIAWAAPYGRSLECNAR